MGRFGSILCQKVHYRSVKGGSELTQLAPSFVSWWFQPTHLKNMLVKMGSSSPGIRGENKKKFELPPTSFLLEEFVKNKPGVSWTR